MKIVLSVPGTWHYFQVARELLARGLLEKMYTSFPRFKVARYGIPKNVLECLPLGEAFIQTANRLPGGTRSFVGNALYRAKYEIFDNEVASRLRGDGDRRIYQGLSSSQSQSLLKAKRSGMIAVLERASTHVSFQNAIMAEEYARHGVRIKSHQPRWLVEKEFAEYEAADRILVPSEFVKQTFIDYGVPAEKLIKVPYGTNLNIGAPVEKKRHDGFRLVYVGWVGFRKGALYAMRAVEDLRRRYPDIHLTLVGPIQPEFKPLLEKHRGACEVMGLVSREKLSEIFADSDAFVFPSLEEGLALSITEAMARGLPAIVTVNSGGAEVVTEGADGYIVPVRDEEAIKDRVLRLYRDRDLCRGMGEAARAAALRQSWSKYTHELTAEYERLLRR